MRKYFIRKSAKESGLVVLWTRVQRRNPKIDLWFSSYVYVDRETWEEATKGDLSAWNKFIETEDGAAIKGKLESIDATIKNLTKQGIFDKDVIDDAIKGVAFAEEREVQAEREQQEQERKAKEEQLKAQAEAERNANVMLYIDEVIAAMKNHTRKTADGSNYKDNSIKAWQSFRGVLARFMEKHPFTWADINRNFAVKFQCYMEQEEGYLPKTCNKYLVTFRAFTQMALNDGKHTNTQAVAYKAGTFHEKRIKDSDKKVEVYLNMAELQALYDMPLTGLQEQVRDTFLIGTYLCQRYSDFSSLSPKNITKTNRGTDVVKLEQQKTGTKVVIPIVTIWGDNLSKLLKKYDYHIPKISDAITNRYLKTICALCAVNTPSLNEDKETVLTLLERKAEQEGKMKFRRNEKGVPIKHKYECVTTHTARRSGITNLVASGLFTTHQLMSISGHLTERNFWLYVKLSGDEKADTIAEIAEAAMRDKDVF